MNKSVVKEILSWVLVFAIAFVAAFLIKRFVIYTVEVPTGSMIDTIRIGDKIMTSRLSYVFGDPKRGDVVVFTHDPEGIDKDYIKRIIGLPGETIEGHDGKIYINGEPINEPYLYEEMLGEFGPYEIPEDCYFMMGDNRNNSGDCRYWEDKFINRDQFIGKAFFTINRFKTFPRIDY